MSLKEKRRHIVSLANEKKEIWVYPENDVLLVVEQLRKERDRMEQWHKGECRGFKDCSICLFLKRLKEKIDELFGTEERRS